MTGNIDGPVTTSRFMNPLGLALDYYHRVMIVGDSYSIPQGIFRENGKTYKGAIFKYSLRKLSLLDNTVTTLAGRSSMRILHVLID